MDLLRQAPAFGADAAAAIARDMFGIDGTAAPLPSERDQNFLIDAAASGRGGRYVLKIANAADERALLEAQNAAMDAVAEATSLCPRVVRSTNGAAIETLPAARGGGHFVRLVTWIPGVTLGSLPHHPPVLLRDLGRGLASVDRALAAFDHPAVHRDFYWDLANGLDIVRAHGGDIADPALRRLVTTVAAGIERDDAPAFASLRRSVIHNDANDHNVVVCDEGSALERRQRVQGFVDFGDMVYSFTAADLAVAIAYAILDKPDPLEAAAAVTAGYHEAYALAAEEVGVLFGLVCLRLCASASIAADQQRQRPGDSYLAISQAAIARTLPRLAAIPRRLADAAMRQACGLRASPAARRVVRALSARTFAPIVGTRAALEAAPVLDLSVGSPLVSGDARENDAASLERRIADATGGAPIAIGRYGEARLLYTDDAFAAADVEDDAGSGISRPASNRTMERRSVHLGIDLFAAAATPVHAPLDGIVHALADNDAPQDYGPVVILRHTTAEGDAFFTLYGHLERGSLHRLRPGQPVREGEAFAAIGDASVNGGWTPHVHVQLIVDLLDLGCDFPGVCRASQWRLWSALCPDPGPIAGTGGAAVPRAESSARTILATRRERVGPNLSVSYRAPLTAVRGWMQYLFDENGRRYLDAYNNVPHVGHGHPRVVRAAADQMRVLNTNTRYLHRLLGEYADRLAQTLPDPLRVCYFVNSGSEANELALRLARACTGGTGVVVLEGAYHGNTTTLVDISPYKFAGPGGSGRKPWVRAVPLPDVYRGPFKATDEAAGAKYAAAVPEAIDALAADGVRLAAYIAESAPSVGGQIILPRGYLAAVYGSVRQAGGVCIADEVQTGYGRLGRGWYAFEDQAVVPDIAVLGKPIGNGYPIGAVVTTPEIAAAFDNGMEFFSTFGGSTVSCACGLAVLDVMRDERLIDHARIVGAHLLDRLGAIAARHPIVGDVRGAGLFAGVELVRDRATLEPATDAASYVTNRLREEGVLIGTEGPHANILKIRPPMPFDRLDADHLAAVLDRVLAELEA
ncbi:MAG TPA: aminotransferase class III-fold pyridoxal phosphate-dependent enzyme [Vicinamibacterales bacterium]|nr:aminotransferase class III-fold pyridoxal phosphate-dependent enzyme [Vicinamibacterales bacterium]